MTAYRVPMPTLAFKNSKDDLALVSSCNELALHASPERPAQLLCQLPQQAAVNDALVVSITLDDQRLPCLFTKQTILASDLDRTAKLLNLDWQPEFLLSDTIECTIQCTLHGKHGTVKESAMFNAKLILSEQPTTHSAITSKAPRWQHLLKQYTSRLFRI